MSLSQQVSICYGEHNGFIWCIDTANSLRMNHRILGNFNNHICKQNNQNKKRKLNDENVIIGMPFILNKYEIRLCFELQIVSIIYKCINKNTFQSLNMNHTNNSNNRNNKNQISETKNDIIQQFFIENNLKRIESFEYENHKKVGQKRKLNETNILSEQKWQDIKDLELLNTKNIINKFSMSQKITNKKMKISPSNNDFVLFPNKLFVEYSLKNMFSDYNPSSFWSKLFNFESSTNQYDEFEEEYKIYKDLYDKKFYILLDRRFGGNFIVYDKSPTITTKHKIHSKYIVKIISKYHKNYKLIINILNKYCKQNDTKLLELDIKIMSFVRIAVNVKKQMLFSYVDSKTNNVKYYLIKWHYYKNTNIDKQMNIDKEMWYQVYSDYHP